MAEAQGCHEDSAHSVQEYRTFNRGERYGMVMAPRLRGSDLSRRLKRSIMTLANVQAESKLRLRNRNLGNRPPSRAARPSPLTADLTGLEAPNRAPEPTVV